MKTTSLEATDRVDTDYVVSESSEQGGTISRPSQRDGIWNLSMLTSLLASWLTNFINQSLGLKIPDLDGRGGGSDQPVTVWREDQRVNDVTSIQQVQVLALGEVPESDNSVLSTRGAERAIRGDSDGVQVAVVALKVVLDSEVGGTPNLDKTIPASRDENRGVEGWREADARDPLSVTTFSQGKLALTEGVPELDSAISGARNNLTVVRREGNREDILGVSNESAGALASADFPETQRSIPRTGKGELSIRTDDNIRDEVVVASKRTLGIANVLTIIGESPDDDRLEGYSNYLRNQ